MSTAKTTKIPHPMLGKYRDCSTVLEKAQLAYALAFNRFPYTNLSVINDLMMLNGSTWDGWFVKPSLIKDGSLVGLGYGSIEDRDKGRCTSFAVTVADALMFVTDDFDFEFYDLIGEKGRHRVARCKRTYICICSASSKGPIVLPKDVMVIPGDGQIKYSFSDDGSIQYKPRDTLRASTPTTGEKSLLQCYQEVYDVSATKLRPLCLFRHYEQPTLTGGSGKAQFFGWMVWDIHEHQLELIPDFDDHQSKKNRESIIKYKWAQGGEPDDHELCVETIRKFCDVFGGPSHNVQYAAVEEIVMCMMYAAARSWGDPVATGPLPGAPESLMKQYNSWPEKYQGDRYASWFIPWKYTYGSTGKGWGQNDDSPDSHPLQTLSKKPKLFHEILKPRRI